jgi:hypothetical protein
MPESHPAACRRSAERCRRRAEAAQDEASKVRWLKFAEERSKVAEEAERAAGADSVRVSNSSDAKQFRVRWRASLAALLRGRVS